MKIFITILSIMIMSFVVKAGEITVDQDDGLSALAIENFKTHCGEENIIVFLNSIGPKGFLTSITSKTFSNDLKIVTFKLDSETETLIMQQKYNGFALSLDKKIVCSRNIKLINHSH